MCVDSDILNARVAPFGFTQLEGRAAAGKFEAQTNMAL